MATMLLGQGASIPARNIILAGAAAVEELAWARPEARVLAVAGPAICALAAERGLRLVEESAEAVLLCRHPGLRYADIADAVQALHRGTELWVANPDLTHPAADGTPVPETGAVLAALLACVHAAQPRMVGKPAPLLFRQALGLMGCRAAEAAMIGDNPATDGAGVAAVGMPFLLVGRGEGALAADLDSLLAERRDSVTELSGRYHRSVTAPE
jgi:ribonucleotide monophosphatase NagD (HAD superfamily)